MFGPRDQMLNFLSSDNYFTPEKKNSRAWLRSTDHWVMGPARFHCASLLCSCDGNRSPKSHSHVTTDGQSVSQSVSQSVCLGVEAFLVLMTRCLLQCSEVEVEVKLRPIVSRLPSGAHDQIFVFCLTVAVSSCGAPSLKGRWVCIYSCNYFWAFPEQPLWGPSPAVLRP
jgi:hypothetical protein